MEENYPYTIAFCLYTFDAKRGAEVRVRSDGQAYFVELEWVEGTTFKVREPKEEIGPYKTVEEAEIVAVNRPWFLKQENSN